MDTQLLTTKEVARRLQLSRARVYALLAAGDLPAVRIGRAVRVPQEGLRRWLESKTVPPTSAGLANDADHRNGGT